MYHHIAWAKGEEQMQNEGMRVLNNLAEHLRDMQRSMRLDTIGRIVR